MLDGILGRGFTSKCKSLIKATRSRIELVRRRAEAKQKFLKEDLAKLLANGLDINAYGRTEEYMAGQGLLSCYGFIELSCEYIVKQLPSMQKQSECPEECREALASLMFAAARFSDLPELRDLRDLIQERYGSGLESFVNQKFVEQLASRTPSMEKRIKLLQDISSEFVIQWDSAGFQHRMARAEGKPINIGPSHGSAYNYNLGSQKGSTPETNGQKLQNVLSKEKSEASIDRQIRNLGRDYNGIKNDKLEDHFFQRKEKVNENKPIANKEGSYSTKENNDFPVYRREELTVDRDRAKKEKYDTSQSTSKSGNSSRGRGKDGVYSGYEKQERSHNPHDTPRDKKFGVYSGYEKQERSHNSHDTPKGKNFGVSSHGRSEEASSYAGVAGKSDDVSPTRDPISEKKKAISTSESQEGEGKTIKSYNGYACPPPYVKSKDKFVPPPYVKPGDNKDKANRGFDKSVSEFNGHFTGPSSHSRVDVASSPDPKVENIEPTEKSSHRQDREIYHENGIPLPKPRSVRRKHHRSARNNDEVGNSEDPRGGHKSSRRREHSKKGLHCLLDDEKHRRDEEEKALDKLLLHYSTKSLDYDIEKLRRKPQNQGSHQERSRRDEREIPARSISLPHEQATPPSETTKVYTRANSFQPDNRAQHVHPKLPDYEDLAARFAALRGR